MQVEIAVLADAANISREGKLNICGVFQNIFAPSVPTGWPVMTLVLQIRLDPDEAGRPHGLQIWLTGPDGKPVQQFPPAQFEAPADPGARKITVPLTINFAGMVFPLFGLYTFELAVDGQTLSAVELEVGQIPAPQAPMPQRPGQAA